MEKNSKIDISKMSFLTVLWVYKLRMVYLVFVQSLWLKEFGGVK